MAYNKLTIEEKISTKAIVDGECLIWIGDKDSNGYGRIRYNGMKNYPVHRLVYELKNGVIDDGLVIRHSCDNPSCININHLCTGTQKENVKDSVNRGRAIRAKGEEHGRSKLTQAQVDEIRSLYKPNKYRSGTSVLAKQFGVSKTTILKIVRNKLWTEKC